MTDPLHSSNLKNTTCLSQSQDLSRLIQTQQDSEAIRNHYDFLIDLMSPEFGLVDKLYSKRTLSEIQKDEIEAASLIQKKNEILLKHIVHENSTKELFEALKECGQSHLVKYVETDGVYREEFDGNWPLMEKERTILLINYETLIDLLDSRDLVGLLYQSGVLNMRQRNLVSFSKWTNEEQNKVLMNILRKGSLDGYWQTIRCLHASNQSHIAKIFESGGVVVRIDTNLQTETSNMTEMENFLATEITNLLRHSPHSEASRILGKVQLNLVGAAAKYSVSLFFLCSYLGDVDRLKQMETDGQLKKFVEDLFNRLVEFPMRIKVTLKWSRDLSSKSRKRIKAIQAKVSIDQPKKTTIESLPLELLDIILQGAYLRYIIGRIALIGDRDSDFIVSLGSVNALWFKRILQKRFKKSIWPQLRKIYRREFHMHLKFRDCLCYLEEAMQVEEVSLMRQDLQKADFLTDLQIARLPRKRAKNKRGRRSELLTILAGEFLPVRREREKKDILHEFIRFLRQRPIAKAIEYKGETAKVLIRQPKDSCSRRFSRRLDSLKFNDRRELKSDDVQVIIKQLIDSGLEILHSFVDRGVIVWIRCRSQRAVENLKELYKSQTLIDLLYRLANEENDRNRRTKDIHLEVYSQRKKHLDTNFFSNVVMNLEGRLEMEKLYEYSIGVTKLRNKIFVLGFTDSNPTPRFGVCVFDDQHPFKFQREMVFEDIKDAKNISSSEKNFCLYIADFGAKCIWKIRPPDEDKLENGEFNCTALECPVLSKFNFFTMTVIVGGQILIIGDRKPILLFFESESDLNRPIRVDLPDAIYLPEQVAENSTGNFIILHQDREIYSPGDKNPWAVSEVDRNGKTIIRHHLRASNQLINANEPTFLLVDSKDTVILSDKRKSRLIFLDFRFRCIGFLRFRKYEENKLVIPWKMYSDGGKEQLIVAFERIVFVFSFRGI